MEKNNFEKLIYITDRNIEILSNKQHFILWVWFCVSRRKLNKFISNIETGMAANFAFTDAQKLKRQRL